MDSRKNHQVTNEEYIVYIKSIPSNEYYNLVMEYLNNYKVSERVDSFLLSLTSQC